MNFREIILKINDFDVYADIFIAQMAELGFDSFQEEAPNLKAYIEDKAYRTNILDDLKGLEDKYELISNLELEKINWNEEWEKNFQPLSVDKFCYIRAPFHSPSKGFEYELIIEPKMSFGTGHHATTQNMIRLMKSHPDFKSVLDLGSGTGILAILASKMGAEKVYATDIEEWAYENMQENFARNHTDDCKAILGSLPLSELKNKKFDLVLANINKNVLLEQIPLFVKQLNENGLLFLSGFYIEDEEDINEVCEAHSLKKISLIEKDKWLAVAYQLT